MVKVSGRLIVLASCLCVTVQAHNGGVKYHSADSDKPKEHSERHKDICRAKKLLAEKAKDIDDLKKTLEDLKKGLPKAIEDLAKIQSIFQYHSPGGQQGDANEVPENQKLQEELEKRIEELKEADGGTLDSGDGAAGTSSTGAMMATILTLPNGNRGTSDSQTRDRFPNILSAIEIPKLSFPKPQSSTSSEGEAPPSALETASAQQQGATKYTVPNSIPKTPRTVDAPAQTAKTANPPSTWPTSSSYQVSSVPAVPARQPQTDFTPVVFDVGRQIASVPDANVNPYGGTRAVATEPVSYRTTSAIAEPSAQDEDFFENGEPAEQALNNNPALQRKMVLERPTDPRAFADRIEKEYKKSLETSEAPKAEMIVETDLEPQTQGASAYNTYNVPETITLAMGSMHTTSPSTKSDAKTEESSLRKFARGEY